METEPIAPEELVDIDEANFREEFNRTVAIMRQEAAWFFVSGLYKGSPVLSWDRVEFKRVLDRRILALGRSDYYDKFMEDFKKQELKNIFQSDYMLWVDPKDPYTSLRYYIDSAEEIHFSLEGVSPGDFKTALAKRGRTKDRRDLGTPYMTVWE